MFETRFCGSSFSWLRSGLDKQALELEFVVFLDIKTRNEVKYVERGLKKRVLVVEFVNTLSKSLTVVVFAVEFNI